MTKKREHAVVTQAREAKARGIKYLASVVKSVCDTEYLHLVSVDDIISAGRWIPAVKGEYPCADGQGYWHGRIGQTAKSVPWAVTEMRGHNKPNG